MIPEDIIIEHITNVYEFNITPCLVPKNHFQNIKKHFYFFILHKISRNLFFFLRDKISPVKYRDERPDGSIWFEKRNIGKLEYELVLYPVPPEVARLEKNVNGTLVASGKGNYSVKLYHENIWKTNTDTWTSKFFINVYDLPDTITAIDKNFSKVPELKQLLRNHKISTIN